MRTTAYVLAAIIISTVSFALGYSVGCRNGYIYALIDRMNNTDPKYMLEVKDDKQVRWTGNDNYKGVSQ